MPLFLFFNTKTMDIKSIEHNSIAMTSIKILYPDGIRTRVIKYPKFTLVVKNNATIFAENRRKSPK
jgi:hypothetical protein